VGIDLSKLGLPSAASLVAASNKVPSLQANGTGKTTNSAEVDFTIVQSEERPAVSAPKKPIKTPAEEPVKESDLQTPSTIYENAEFKPLANAPGKFSAAPAPLDHPNTHPNTRPYYWPSISSPLLSTVIVMGKPMPCGPPVGAALTCMT
jgi:hypothetical protein